MKVFARTSWPHRIGTATGTRERVFLSECGDYYARKVPGSTACDDYDVLSVDGVRLWLARRYEPWGWGDTDRRYTHAEFFRCVTAWSNHGRETRARRWIEAFGLGFSDHDTNIAIIPYSGNTVLRQYTAEFRQQVWLVGFPETPPFVRGVRPPEVECG